MGKRAGIAGDSGLEDAVERADGTRPRPGAARPADLAREGEKPPRLVEPDVGSPAVDLAANRERGGLRPWASGGDVREAEAVWVLPCNGAGG